MDMVKSPAIEPFSQSRTGSPVIRIEPVKDGAAAAKRAREEPKFGSEALAERRILEGARDP
jgi:hypothetical protein